ncbi:hypothetical protein QA601_03100 [Chitinispirillales bacterium ANBcel5]|uniref:hypothetical protein n=1 Tax=Cellulosispirillum alkaliphilum TaxID=3039283 RepID=UPI002A52FC27|nr:hypothetical protein [Chitinispirillales bacterium ANBcel5]
MERVKTPGAVHFVEYVKLLPPKWVFEHFIRESNGSRRILSSSMIEEEAAKFISKAKLTERFEELDEELKLKCALAYLSGGNGINISEYDGIDNPLVQSFLVFGAKDNSGNIRYFGFNEFEPFLRTLLVETFLKAAKTDEQSHLPPIPFWRPLCDLTAVAGLAFQGQITKTKTGGLSRSALNQLKKITHDKTLSGKSGQGDPSASGFLISFCIKKSFLTDTGDEFALDSRCFKTWLAKPFKDQLRQMTDYASIYCGAIRVELLKQILTKSDGYWISSSVFSDTNLKFFTEGLKAFQAMGMLETRKSNNEIQFAVINHFNDESEQITHEGFKATPIVIMPDFTTILPQEIHPAHFFQYMQIGKATDFDKVYKGSIDKDVISSAMSKGVESTTIRDWLVEHSAPTNVISTVQEWMREFLRLYVSSNSILVSSEERVTVQISSYEPLRKHLEPVSAHAVFRIHPGSENKVKEILTSLGFDPRMPSEDGVKISCEDHIPEALKESLSIWEPVTEIDQKTEPHKTAMRGTKYGEELKELELSEMTHVIDYAILTGQRIIIDYEGSPYIKPNIYTILPLQIQKGTEPIIEAEVPRTRTRKQFYLRKIRKIGVISK